MTPTASIRTQRVAFHASAGEACLLVLNVFPASQYPPFFHLSDPDDTRSSTLFGLGRKQCTSSQPEKTNTNPIALTITYGR